MVVEGVHAVRVARESRRRRHILDAHARPETVLVAERVEARLLGDSRPGQNDDAPAFHTCPTEPVPERMTRSEEHKSAPPSIMRSSYAALSLKKQTRTHL